MIRWRIKKERNLWRYDECVAGGFSGACSSWQVAMNTVIFLIAYRACGKRNAEPYRKGTIFTISSNIENRAVGGILWS